MANHYSTSQKGTGDSQVQQDWLFRRAVESAVDGIAFIDFDLLITYANPARAHMHGYEPDELIGKQVLTMYQQGEHPQDIAATVKDYGSWEGETVGLRKDGSTFRMWQSISRINDFEGNMVAIVSITRDITEKKQNEEKLAWRSKQLMNLLDASRKINSAVDTGSVMRLMVEHGMALVSANMGTAGLYMDGSMVFREYNNRGQLVPIDHSFRPGYGVPGWVMENMQPYVTNDAENDPHVIPHIQRELGFCKLVDVPIISSDGRLLGCFDLHNAADGKSFTGEDVELLTGLANQAAVALVNAELAEQLRKYTEDLRKSEETLRLVVEGSPDFFFYIQDRTGVFTYVSPSVEDMTGYSVDDWQSHYTRFLTDSPMNSEVITNTERTLATGEFAPSYPVEVFNRNGGRVTLEVYERPIFEDNEIVGIRGVARDVTQLRRAECAEEEFKRQSEQQMRVFYRDTIFSVTDGKLVMVDQKEAEKICPDPLFPPMSITEAKDIPLARQEISVVAVKSGMEGSKIDDLLLCLGEAAANAYKHAGGGLISVCEGEGSLLVMISDCGPGMDSLALPKLTLLKGYSGGKSLGMGYATMLALADKIYLNTGPQGTTVVIEMAKQPRTLQADLSLLPDLW